MAKQGFNVIDQSGLKSLLRYDAESGRFFWINRSGRISAGGLAGGLIQTGYRIIKIGGRRYLAHRIAWLYVHGKFPDMHIDHKNGDKDDNRIENLRDVAPMINAQNLNVLKSTNTSGLPGIHWHKGNKSWQAKIRLGYKTIHIGNFDSKEDAHNAYVAKKKEIHPEWIEKKFK